MRAVDSGQQRKSWSRACVRVATRGRAGAEDGIAGWHGGVGADRQQRGWLVYGEDAGNGIRKTTGLIVGHQECSPHFEFATLCKKLTMKWWRSARFSCERVCHPPIQIYSRAAMK